MSLPPTIRWQLAPLTPSAELFALNHARAPLRFQSTSASIHPARPHFSLALPYICPTCNSAFRHLHSCILMLLPMFIPSRKYRCDINVNQQQIVFKHTPALRFVKFVAHSFAVGDAALAVSISRGRLELMLSGKERPQDAPRQAPTAARATTSGLRIVKACNTNRDVWR